MGTIGLKVSCYESFRMRVGVTVRFQNSYFSGTLPQMGLSIGKALGAAGHEVTYLYPKDDPSWFIDVLAAKPSNIRVFSPEQRYDLVVEVVWSLKAEERAVVATHVVLLAPYPATFYDTESSVYHWNPTVRNVENTRRFGRTTTLTSRTAGTWNF